MCQPTLFAYPNLRGPLRLVLSICSISQRKSHGSLSFSLPLCTFALMLYLFLHVYPSFFLPNSYLAFFFRSSLIIPSILVSLSLLPTLIHLLLLCLPLCISLFRSLLLQLDLSFSLSVLRCFRLFQSFGPTFALSPSHLRAFQVRLVQVRFHFYASFRFINFLVSRRRRRRRCFHRALIDVTASVNSKQPTMNNHKNNNNNNKQKLAVT